MSLTSLSSCPSPPGSQLDSRPQIKSVLPASSGEGRERRSAEWPACGACSCLPCPSLPRCSACWRVVGRLPPDLSGARERTVADGSAAFTITIDVDGRGSPRSRSSETGTVSFRTRPGASLQARPGRGRAAGADPERPVHVHERERRRGPRRSRGEAVDEARHAASPGPGGRPPRRARARPRARLPRRGRRGCDRGGRRDDRLRRGRPTTRRRSIRAGCVPACPQSIGRQPSTNDYPAEPFPADFWLDDRGRLRRVVVAYRTAGGTRDQSSTAASREFGTAIDLDPAGRRQDPGHHARSGPTGGSRRPRRPRPSRRGLRGG